MSIFFVDLSPPIITCPSKTIVAAGAIDQQTSKLWWPFLELNDDRSYVAKISCDPPFLSEFSTSPTHVTCEAEDNMGNRDDCALDVHYACNILNFLMLYI